MTHLEGEKQPEVVLTVDDNRRNSRLDQRDVQSTIFSDLRGVYSYLVSLKLRPTRK